MATELSQPQQNDIIDLAVAIAEGKHLQVVKKMMLRSVSKEGKTCYKHIGD